MLLIFLYCIRRSWRGFVSYVLAFSLIWSPVMQARAFIPAAVYVAMEVAAPTIAVAAATRAGPLLTHTNVALGAGFAALGYLVGSNWNDIVNYISNSEADYNTAVSGGVDSYASMSSSVNVNSVSTDVSSYTWGQTSGNVIVGHGNVPMKDALSALPDQTDFPYTIRNDGKLLFQPKPQVSFSSSYNSSGFKDYLCPIAYIPPDDPLSTVCKTLPDEPFGKFQYNSRYRTIGIACIDPMDCAKAYVSARLVELSWLYSNQTLPDGRRVYAYSISNVRADFASCYDSRYSSYSAFSGYRCPVTVEYDLADLGSSTPDLITPKTEQINVDVIFQKPSFFQANTLTEYLEMYPLAGEQPLAAQSIANIMNAMMLRAASMPGYVGLKPYTITAADVQTALQPARVVPLSSLVKPLTHTGSGGGTTPGTPTTPGGSIDLGPDPGVSQPNLEGTPTATQILSPIFDLFPSLRNFQVPGHTSQCPALVVPLWGADVTTNAHCDLIESQRAVIGAAALVGWSIAAIIIVLGA